MKKGLLGGRLGLSIGYPRRPRHVIAGLDLSRRRINFDARRAGGELAERGACPVDVDGLRGLADRLLAHDAEVLAVIESMNGACFVHDQLERHGLDVLICDAERAKGLAPLACKTDELDAHVLAELARRELVPGGSGSPAPAPGRTASAPASGCSWCAGAPRSRTACTRR
jgi:transposase